VVDLLRSDNELRACVVLLGDDQPTVVAAARQALLDDREASVPFLAEAVRSANPILRGRARLLLDQMRRNSLYERWMIQVGQPDEKFDLEACCLLMSELWGEENPQAATSFLDAIAGIVRAHLVNVGPVQALNEVLFDNLGFRGGDFDQPESHWLSAVLNHRCGVPISLATIYVLVGRRLGLPVYGIAMPAHYLARFETPEGAVFIDCYNRGKTYRPETLVDWLLGKGLTFDQSHLKPCSDRFTLFRMLTNLEKLYQSQSDALMVDQIRRWRDALQVQTS